MKLNLEVKTAQGITLLRLAVTSRNALVVSRNARVIRNSFEFMISVLTKSSKATSNKHIGVYIYLTECVDKSSNCASNWIPYKGCGDEGTKKWCQRSCNLCIGKN